MPKFRFNLQPVLESRKMTEQKHQRIVAQFERQRMTLEDELRRRQAGISQGKSQLRDSLTGTIDVQALRMHASSSMQILREAQRIVLELAGAHKRLEAARLELIEATRQRRAVELLRDRRFAEWKKAEEKRETAAIDELAVIAAARDGRVHHRGSEHAV